MDQHDGDTMNAGWGESTETAATGAVEFSAAGRARRESMIFELQGAMRRVHRRRRVVRRVAALALITCGVAVAVRGLLIGSTSSGPAPAPNDRVAMDRPGVNATAPPSLAPADEPNGTTHSSLIVVIERIEAETDVAQRYAIPESSASPTIIQRISDEELIETLATFGRPAGLVRIGGEARLTINIADDHSNQHHPLDDDGSMRPGLPDRRTQPEGTRPRRPVEA